MLKATGISLVILTGSAFTGLACLCVGLPSPSKALEDADVVVAGVIVEVGPVILWEYPGYPRAQSVASSADLMGWRVAITDVWKGEPADTMVIYSARSGVSCGMEFKVGKRYIIYAYHRRPKDLRDYLTSVTIDSIISMTGKCGRTREFDSAGDDLDELPPPVWTSTK